MQLVDLAIREGKVTFVEALLKAGADPDLKDGSNNTPLDIVEDELATLRSKIEQHNKNPKKQTPEQKKEKVALLVKLGKQSDILKLLTPDSLKKLFADSGSEEEVQTHA